MKTRSWFSKLLTASLAVLMLAGMTPVDTSAAPREAEETEPGSNLFLDKTATLQDDGTYTIQLEAFSTGESTTVMTQTPTDIVLVLDVSGSMDENFTYVSGQEWTSVTDTVASTPDDAYHHCPDGSYSPITWTEKGNFLGFGRYRYVCDNCRASRKWDSPTLVNRIPGEGDDDSWNLWRYTDIERTEEKITALKEAVNSFLSSVANRNANIGAADQQHRVAIVKFASESTRDTIGNDRDWNGYNYTQTIAGMTTVTNDSLSSLTGAVDALTPGGATAADKGLDMAQSILNNNSTDSSRNKVVVFFTDGEPTYGSSFSSAVANDAVATAKELKDSGATIYTIGLFSGADPSDTSDRSNAYMNGVSSNYPAATSYTNLGSGSNNGYYKTVSSTGSLVDIFEEIEDSISTTTVTLTDEAELRDILNTGFVLTEDSDVTVQTDDYSGRDRAGNRVFAGNPQTYSATVKRNNNTVTVSGFNFSQEYLIDGNTPDESDFTAAVQGRKLIVTITNVEATDDAVTDNLISTNNAASGIYENADATTPFALFKQPQTQLSSKAYVLDYAQETVLTDLPSSVTHMDSTGMHGFAQAATSLNNMKYGVASGSTYTPKTMQWDGYDKYYVFGKWNTTPEGVTTGDNTWTKVSVLPANNVYYEDTFITNTNDDGTGTVGIVYDSSNWKIVEGNEAGTNGENANGNIQGWEEALNETGDSDGTIHMTSAKGATATFTFTGTGFDVYSRTNMTSGKVFAKISWTDSEGTKHNKGLFVDTVSASGEYYGVPTLWFSGEYNTYTVTLAVQSNAAGNYSYCIDGIRIYNPLNPELEDTDSTVQDSYDEELNAHFETVRSLLLSAGDLDQTVNEETGETITPDQQVNGVVFIDKTADGETGVPTDDIGVYEDYGSKSEVYLAPGQAIAFNVGVPGLKVQIGLKAPEGQSVTAKWSNGGTAYEASSLNHTTDMYYTAVADDSGFIVVENTRMEGSDNLLSVTKIKFLNADDGVAETSLSGMTEAVSRFSAMPVTAYDLEAETELPETDVTENETETETEPETEPVEEPSLDVVIENPETETEETTTGGENSANNSLAELLNSLFSSFRRWF